MYPELKENRPHGTDNYPYTQYHMHNIFHAFQIPVQGNCLCRADGFP